ncbi:MAG: exopolygalacturonase, partial [Duncaniella sp.]|nr:exopolygalacturonase [Duncaniella sp.]
MKNLAAATLLTLFAAGAVQAAGFTTFPDGSKVSEWFNEAKPVNADKLGKKYTVTDYGVVNDSTMLQTEAIQAVIDKAAEAG